MRGRGEAGLARGGSGADRSGLVRDAEHESAGLGGNRGA